MNPRDFPGFSGKIVTQRLAGKRTTRDRQTGCAPVATGLGAVLVAYGERLLTQKSAVGHLDFCRLAKLEELATDIAAKFS
jgi:hypothetical protein